MPIVLGLVVVGDAMKGIFSTMPTLDMCEAIMTKVLPKLAINDHKRTLLTRGFEIHYKRQENVTVFAFRLELH